jgi:hypothetical protein
MQQGHALVHRALERLGRAEVDGGTDCDGAQIPRLLHGTEQNLVVAVRVAQQFVVVDFANERDAVGVGARNRSQDAEGRRDRVAATL